MPSTVNEDEAEWCGCPGACSSGSAALPSLSWEVEGASVGVAQGLPPLYTWHFPRQWRDQFHALWLIAHKQLNHKQFPHVRPGREIADRIRDLHLTWKG